MNNYISLKEATRYCNYSQDYLKLRARQGKLKAMKIGRNWVTSRQWVEEYAGCLKSDIKRVQCRTLWRSNLPKFKEIILGLVVILIIIGIFINLGIFSEYFQWQTANLSGVFSEGLKIIPGRIIEMK